MPDTPAYMYPDHTVAWNQNWLGRHPLSTSDAYFFNGNIDDFRFYRHALTSAEVSVLSPNSLLPKPCNLCPVDTYKTGNGTEACTPCPQFSSTMQVVGSTNISQCKCIQGHGQQQTQGGHICVQCDGTQYSGLSDANITICKSCPLFSTSMWPRSSPERCMCNSAHTSSVDNKTCVKCEIGKFKEGFGSSTCQTCEGNSSSINGEWCDSCALGFREVLGGIWYPKCVPCDPGTYNSVLGSTAFGRAYVWDFCTPCPLNSISPAASTNVSACLCKAGFTSKNRLSCEACALGKYNP